jgi:hypothetical protein
MTHRHGFHRVRVACAVLGALLALAWLASIPFRFSVLLRQDWDRAYFLVSDWSRLYVQVQLVEPAPPRASGWTVDLAKRNHVDVSGPGGSVGVAYGIGESLSGFPVYGEHLTPAPLPIAGTTFRIGCRFYALPYPLAVLALCAPLTVHFVRNRRSYVRMRNRLCARCGYDLRASPERCPECGAIVSVTDVSS